MNAPSLRRLLARGRTADVHEWNENEVLKLFHPWFPREDAEYELTIARAVHAGGVKAPAARGLIQVDGRDGLVYERVHGEPMPAALQRRPWKIFDHARAFAGLHAQMHDCVFNADIPSQRRRLDLKIQRADALPTPLKPVLSNLILSLPESDRVCHGDFHPANVLISPKEAVVIDWMDATRGNPLADVARTSVILLGAAQAQVSNPVLKSLLRLFHSAYLKHYFRLRPGGEEEHRRWLPIVAGARLSENISELEEWLAKEAGKAGR